MIERLRKSVLAVAGVLVAAAVVAAAAHAGAMIPSAPVVGANVNVSVRAGNQTEATVAVNPNDTNQVFVSSNNDPTVGSGMFAATSADGGATWTRRLVATGDDGLAAACCDPSASWDTFGNVFLTYIDGATRNIVLGVSTDGGATFTSLGSIATGGIDQPTVTTGAGAVWVTWMQEGTIRARGAAVTGLGVANIGALSPEQAAPGSDGGNFGDIAIGPNGEVVVTYQIPSGGEGPATVFVNTDADGFGPNGFGERVAATPTNVGGFDFIPAQPSRSVDAEAGLAYDRTNGAHRGRLYLLYTDETARENNDTDVHVRFSDDNGATWSAGVRINDDATTRSQFLPRISLDQSTGNLAVTWHDARDDTGTDGDGANNDAELWGAFSYDGGTSFTPNFRISAGMSDAKAVGARDGIDFGDYTGNWFEQGWLHAAWADNSNSTNDNPDRTLHQFDVYTARVRAGGPCGANALVRNDDRSTGQIALPFGIDFFGTDYDSLFLNNNGNATFNGPMSTFTPFDLAAQGEVIVAPYFGDVDTRNPASGVLTYGNVTFEGRTAFCASWDGVGVGYYNRRVDKLNKFQLLLVDRSDTGPGNFDIVFNFDQVQWEAGDASEGVDGLGGSSARVGYSNGEAANSLELPGSGVNGALLDSNTATGLIHNSRNSLVPGRYVFPVRQGGVPTGGTIFGFVGPGTQVGAPVQICPESSGGACSSRLTNSSGRYSVSGLPADDYVVTAFPPGGSSLLSTSATVTLAANATVQQDLTLRSPQPPPPGTTITSIGTGSGGIPVVYWNTPLTLTTQGCEGGTGTYEVRRSGSVIRSGSMTEGPPGTYTATIAPLIPNSGPATITITIDCAGSPSTVEFNIYIDPSGSVRTPGGRPVEGATVTLYRSDTGAPGSFTQVPEGDPIMDPSNRTNPVVTGADGLFGWNVVAGFYRVRAQKAGCHAAGNPAQLFAETPVLTIPPPALDLELVLTGPSCPDDVVPPTTTASATPDANEAGWNRDDVTVTLTAADDLGGSGVESITYSSTGAQLIPETTVAGATATLPPITSEGTTTITYRALDLAGNVEDARTLLIKLDKTAPTVTWGTPMPAANAAGWNNTNVTVPFTVSDDAGSGVASPSPATGELVLSEEGLAVTGTLGATDVAGNSATFHTDPFMIDKTAPAVSVGRSPDANANGWNNTDVTAHFSATDNLSGVVAPSSVDVTFSAEGAGQGTERTFTDVAGNSATGTISGINIDKTAPSFDCSASPSSIWPPNHDLVDVAVTCSLADALSGADGFVLESASSSEPDNGLGDGDTDDDLQEWAVGTPDVAGKARAERSGGGDGRVYTLAYGAADKAGNRAASSPTVMVPKSSR